MRLSTTVILLAFVTNWIAYGQTYTISTVAGGALPVNIQGTSASLYTPILSRLIRRATCSSRIVMRTSFCDWTPPRGAYLVAGNGMVGFSGDNGPAASAQLTHPNGVAVDSAGNLYFADTFNARIRKVSNGVITTVAGNGTADSAATTGRPPVPN